MSETKTPLELVEEIRKHSSKLFELSQISKAMIEASKCGDAEIVRTIIKSLAETLQVLSYHNTDLYFSVTDLRKKLEEALLEETEEVDEDIPIEEDLPFVTPADSKEEVEA